MKCLISNLIGLVILASFANAQQSPFKSDFIAKDKLIPDSVMVQKEPAFQSLIQGQLAGVAVEKTDGMLGTQQEISIRGINTIRGGNSPLIVVDGVALTSPFIEGNPWSGVDGLNYQINKELSYILRGESIESVHFLKDASATAIYGIRGANGVIVVNTKRGSKDRRITWNSNVSLSTISKKIDFLSPDQYNAFQQKLGNPTMSGVTADWQKEVFKPAISQNHYFSFLGSSIGTDYRFALNYANQKSISDNTSGSDLSLSAAVDQKINRSISFGSTITIHRNSASLSQSSYYLGASSLTSRLSAAPFEGIVETSKDWVNDYDDKSTGWRVVPSIYAKADLGAGFNLNINAGVDYISQERLRWMGKGLETGLFENGRAGVSELESIQYNADATINFSKKLSKCHYVEALVGGGYYGLQRGITLQYGSDFFNHDLRATGIRFASRTSNPIYTNSVSSHVYALAGAKYVFKDKYSLEGALRADMSLDIKDDVNYYPSVRLSTTVVANTSIYVGWGISGNDQLSPYAYINDYSLGNPMFYIPYYNELDYSARIYNKNHLYDIGASTKLVDNKVTLSGAYYIGNGSDYLSLYNTKMKDNTPSAQNTIKMDKWGFEFSANWQIVDNDDWGWSVDTNIYKDYIKVTHSGSSSILGATNKPGFRGAPIGSMNGEVQYATAYIDGYAPGVFYGYRTNGIVTAAHEDLTPPLNGEPLLRGDIKFVDVNKSGQTDENDKVVIGNPIPKFRYAINTGGRYRNWSFALRFNGQCGGDVLNLNRLLWDNTSGRGNITEKVYNNAWSQTNQAGNYPAIGAKGIEEISDRYIEDASYLSLSHFQINYQFDMKRIKWLKSLGVNVQMANLFTITRYSGYSPQVNSFLGSWSLRGVDLGAYPSCRTFSLGISAKF